MLFNPTTISGVVVVDVVCRKDERGFFARTVCQDEFSACGLPTLFVQSSVSFNTRRGTLRGLHYQIAPKEEGKLVRCTSGALVDVAVDLRPASPTFRAWVGVELTAENHRAVYIPPGCAHGFQTLVDDTEVLYMMTEIYAPDLARGVRWNDAAFGVTWPIEEPILSERDAVYPDFRW
jgi:dTDP-4-dehydrorhamnose 3,5-epimerase